MRKRKPYSRRVRDVQGFSLISVLVAASLMAVVALGMASLFSSGFKANRSMELRSDREALRRMMLTLPDCQPALALCTAPNLVIPVNRIPSGGPPTPLITATGAGTQFGDWTMRAECNSTLDGILLRVTRLAPGGTLVSTASADFLPDPLTKRSASWADPGSLLFDVGVQICPSAPRVAWVPLNCTSVDAAHGYCGAYVPNGSMDDYCRASGYANATSRCKATNGTYGIVYGNLYTSDYYLDYGTHVPGQWVALCLYTVARIFPRATSNASGINLLQNSRGREAVFWIAGSI